MMNEQNVFISEEEQEIRRLFVGHPALRRRVAILINSYRGQVRAYLDYVDGREEKPDSSDIVRAGAKNEVMMQHLGIPILTTHEEWTKCWQGQQETEHGI